MNRILRNCVSVLFPGLLVLGLFVQGNAQETYQWTTWDEFHNREEELRKKAAGRSWNLSEDEQQESSSMGVLYMKKYQELLDKVSSNSRDFSDDEVRELLALMYLASDFSPETELTNKKLFELGDSIYPLLCKEALNPREKDEWANGGGRVSAIIVSYFRKTKEDMTEERKTTLKVLEKFPNRYMTCCDVMGDIGEPEDVPELLSYIKENSYIWLVQQVIRTVGKIAAVSQLPEIEKAVADWEKDKVPGEWQKKFQAEVEQSLANIRQRNNQWIPPSVETPTDTPPAPAP